MKLASAPTGQEELRVQLRDLRAEEASHGPGRYVNFRGLKHKDKGENGDEKCDGFGLWSLW